MAHVNKNKIKTNNSGQALVESIVVIEATFAITVLLFLCAYIVLARKWADYWVYRAALCQTTTRNTIDCHKNLNKKLEQVLPSSIYKMEATWITRKESHVGIRIQIGKDFIMPISSTVNVDL